MGATLTFLVGGSMIWAAADAPNPVQSSLTGEIKYDTNGPGATVTITGGHWNWLSHSSDCNLDRYAAGFAADWNDPNDPGYLVADGIDVGSTKTGDNMVHWNTSGPRCGTFDWIVNGKPHPQGDIQSGLLQHHYADASKVGPVCLVSYDVHGSTTPKDPIAGGSGHNGDNSIEKNNDVASGPGCFNIPLKTPYDLAITKTPTQQNVTLTQAGTATVAWSLAVKNVKGDPSTGEIKVTDNMPAGITLDSVSLPTPADWQCTTTSSSLSCIYQKSSLSLNQSTSDIVVNATVHATGDYTNTAILTNLGDSDSSNNQAQAFVHATPGNQATLDLTISKTGPTQAQVGDTFNYTVTASNKPTSIDAVGPVTVTDTLPTGLTLQSGKEATAGASGWTCSHSGQLITCTHDGMAKNTSVAFTVPVVVGSAAVPSGHSSAQVTNLAHVANDNEPAGNRGDNDASWTTTIGLAPQLDLSIVKSANVSSVKAGDAIGYTLQVANASGAPTTGTVRVTDPMPAGVTIIAGPSGSGWTCTSSTSTNVDCTLNSVLGAGSSAAPITFTALVSSAAGTTVTNIGTVDTPGDTNDTNDHSRTDTPVTPSPTLDVGIVKVASASSAKLGDTLTYTLHVTNGSLADTTGQVTVTDTVPSGLSLQGVSVAPGSPWTCSAIGANITCTRAGLAHGVAADPITVTTTVLSSGAPQVVNTGRVATPGDTNPANDQSTVTTPVTVPQPKLAIVKTAVPASGTAVHRGDGITYTLSYSNDSDTAATGATITDDVPAGTTLDNAGTAGVSGNTLNWTVDVPAHGSGSVSFSVIVNEDVADGAVIRNHAVMSYGGTPTTTNETQHPVSVPNGALSLVKSVDNTAPAFGQLLTYSLVVTATGNVTQTGVTVTDVVPNDTTYEGPVTCSTGCTGSYNAGTNTVTWDVGTMAPGSSVTVTFATRINTPNVPAGTTVTRTIDNVGLVFSNETPTTPSNHVRTPITAVLGVKIVKTPSTPTATLPFTGVGLPVGRAVTDGVLLVLAGMLMLALASGGRRKPNAA